MATDTLSMATLTTENLTIALKITDIRDSKNCYFIKVTKVPFSIGRSIENDLILDHTSMSLHHAQLEILPGEVVSTGHAVVAIKDLDALNGIWVNGKMVGKGETVKLLAGDKIRLGIYLLEFYDENTLYEETVRFKLPEERDLHYEQNYNVNGSGWMSQVPNSCLHYLSFFEPRNIDKVNWTWLGVYLLFLALACLVNTYLHAQLDEDGIRQMILNFFLLCLSFFCGGLSLSLIAKIIKGRFDYFTLIHNGFKVLVIGDAVMFLASLSLINITSEPLIIVLTLLFNGVIVISVLYTYGRIFFPLVRRSSIIVFSTLLFVFSNIGYETYQKFNYDDKSYSLNFNYFFPWRSNYTEDKYPLVAMKNKVNENLDKVDKYRKVMIEKKLKYVKSSNRKYNIQNQVQGN
ncbi:MAG: FHA domain-containing protein [Oligoflexia bacterium]|nr:FHA domain-containing protein [Oligoflexia bacterium]